MNNALFPIIGIIAVVALTGSAMGYVIATSTRADSVARAPNGCVRDQPPASTTAMLVDFTDKPTTANLSQLQKGFSDLRRSVPKNGKAVVASLDVKAESAVNVILEVCNPGTKEGSYTERAGPSPQDQRWRQLYYKPFDAALEKAKNSPPSNDNSPILEAVTTLSQRADFDAAIGERKLIIISDGLQLTPDVYSHFKGGDLWKAYLKSRLAAMTQADLTNVDVAFVYLLRPEFAHRQTAAHREFLRRWFIEHGARSFEIRGIRNEEAS